MELGQSTRKQSNTTVTLMQTLGDFVVSYFTRWWLLIDISWPLLYITSKMDSWDRWKVMELNWCSSGSGHIFPVISWDWPQEALIQECEHLQDFATIKIQLYNTTDIQCWDGILVHILLPEKKCGRFNSQAIRYLICCIKVMSVSKRLLCTHSCGWCLFCTVRMVCCLICVFVVHISCDLWQVHATAKFFFHSFTAKALQFIHVFSQGRPIAQVEVNYFTSISCLSSLCFHWKTPARL